ncbi:accessory gene regulator B family protein [Ruminococcus callidus]|uniref:accessory gene regulator B family protein n=1 Tax=Ruminococcus callidus TaxID=40519 RepID=UPI0035206F9A
MIKIITFLGKSISHFLCEKKVIAEQEVEIYQYGFEILISTALGLLITMAVGIVLNMFFLSVLYYVIFVTVRQWTGGYHADSYLKCNLTFAGITFFTLGMTKLSCMREVYNPTIHGLLLVTVLLIVWKYAPVENLNKPLTEEQKKRNHRAAFIAVIVLEALSCGLYVFSSEVSALAAYTLFSIAVLILISKKQKRRE